MAAKRHHRKRPGLLPAAVLAACLAAAAPPAASGKTAAAPEPPGPSDGDTPVPPAGPAGKPAPGYCVLPGKIRKLSSRFILLLPGQLVRTTAQDCEMRRGAYLSAGRAD